MAYSESKHFTLERLADGIFAVLHREGGWAIANSGIIDLGGKMLVFDTGLTPQAAADLRTAAEELTGQPVDWVVNSHYHNDHIWGNQVFDDGTDIVSSTVTRRLITTQGQLEVDWCQEHSASRLEEVQSRFADEENQEEKADLSMWVDYYQGLVESLPDLSIRLPNITFSERLKLYGSERAAELITFNDGHTGSDTILYLPSERVLFLSDLLFVGCHPHLADGNPGHLVSVLEDISAMDARVLVPGHGPVGNLDDLRRMVEYILLCQRLAGEKFAEGKAEEEIAELEVPEPFATWRFAAFFHANVYFLLQQCTGDGV